MRRRNLFVNSIALGAFALLATACGSGSSSTKPVVGGVPGANTPGYNNGQGQIITGQCVPITQPIGVVGQGVYRDSANIIGGRLPFNGQTVGAMGVSQPTVYGNQYQWNMNGQAYGRSGSDGTIWLQETNPVPVNQAPYGGYPYNQYTPNAYGYQGQNQGYLPYYPTQWAPSQVNLQGSLQLSYLVIQDIQYRFGGGYGAPPIQNGYPNYYQGGFGNWGQPQNNICASGVAMNVGHYNSTVYGGQVYLYLNGTQNGYILYF